MKIRQNLTISATVLAAMWIVFLLDSILPIDLWKFGITPRTLRGLLGLIFSPFLHGSLRHILANSGALFILLTMSLTYSRSLTVDALGVIVLGGGGLVWLFGAPQSVHIGASGVIFGLMGFLLFNGFLRRDIIGILVSILVLFLYGGVILWGFIPRYGVSWIGHLFGFVSGAGAAWLFRKDSPQEKTG